MTTFAHLVPSACLSLFAALPLTAQNLLSYRAAGAANSALLEYPVVSLAFTPAGGPGVPVGILPAPARPAQPHPRGSVAVDDTTGIVYTTNGLASIQRSWYPRLGLVPPTAALPSLPIPAVVGEVHGMAVDPASKHLFLCNGVMMFEVDPLAGMAIVSSWTQSPLNVLTDLEFDPGQPGFVFAVSTVGEIATYARSGGLVGVTVPSYPFPGGMATGLALDRSNVLGAPPEFYVLWDNGDVYRQSTGTVHVGSMAAFAGLTYLASAVNLPGAAACGGSAPIVRTSTLVFDGSGGFGVEVGGFAAGTPFAALVLNAPGFGPATPMPPLGVFWLPGGWTHAFAVLPAPDTSVRFPLPLPPAMAPFRFYAQAAISCPASSAGFVVTDAMQFEISR